MAKLSDLTREIWARRLQWLERKVIEWCNFIWMGLIPIDLFLQCISSLCSCLYLIQCLTARSDYSFPLKAELFLPPAIILNEHEEPIFKYNISLLMEKKKKHSTECQPMNSTESCDCQHMYYVSRKTDHRALCLSALLLQTENIELGFV